MNGAVDLADLAALLPEKHLCSCNKRFADTPLPDGTVVCLICARREARQILRNRRARLELSRRTDLPAMSIPKTRRPR